MINYKFVFWGNINIHIYPLAESLSKSQKVMIVYDSSSFSNRKERMVTYRLSSSLELVDVAHTTATELRTLINKITDEYTIHINTALKNDGSRFHNALKLLMKLKTGGVISLPQEGFQIQGLKGMVNRIKWFYYINVLYRKIQYFGYTGHNAFRDLVNVGCAKKRLFPFLYITKPFDSTSAMQHKNMDKCVKIIFVGAIDDRKNIRTIVRWINEEKDALLAPIELNIYGGYGDEELLYSTINNNKSIRYHGIVPNDEVRTAMLESDIAILPSKYDGWGAVINEALQSGCRVLVSNRCGSASIPKSTPELGEVFDPYNKFDFVLKLNNLLRKGSLTEKERMSIKDWSKQRIHPDVAAKYLIDVIVATNNKTKLPRNIFY